MAGRARRRRRRRKAGPGKSGERKGPQRSCGGGRDGGAVVAADTVRQEPHSNRPLAMTQQHAVSRPSHGATEGRKRGGAYGWRDKGGGSGRVPGAPVLHRCAPAHCTPSAPTGSQPRPARLQTQREPSVPAAAT